MQDSNQNQPGFSVQHNNPFPGQQTYQPPAQFGGSQPDIVIAPQQDPGSRMEITKIDQLLSSGCYSFYYCWLYAMIIFGTLTIFSGVTKYENVAMVIEGICMILYSICMLEALKSKNLKRAQLGIFLGVFSAALTVYALMSQFFYYGFFGSGDDAQTFFYLTGPSLIYDIFVVIMPAWKIKGHLQRRELLLQKESVVSNV